MDDMYVLHIGHFIAVSNKISNTSCLKKKKSSNS